MNPLFQRIACAFGLLLALLAPSAHAISGLRVKCNVEGATVWLDGKDQGACPARLTVKAGKHRLWVKKPIDEDTLYEYVADFDLKDSDVTSVDAELKRVYTAQGWQRKQAAEAEQRRQEEESRISAERKEEERAKRWARGDFQAWEVFKDCADCPEMVMLPAGSFEMGSNSGIGTGWEKPVHSVRIGKAFAIGKTEVTQGQWRSLMGNNPSRFSNCGDDCPVEQVTWNDAKSFIQRLNAKTGKTYRLPSEAEWEYACRAGGTHRYCGSDSNEGAWVWFKNGSTTHAVAGNQANAWGLYDMIGNVSEWTEDCWNDNYNGAPSDGSAWTSGACGKRVQRGGSWSSRPTWASSADRMYKEVDSTDRNYDSGFRLARMLQ